jgi:hypothetical protein
MFNLSNRLVKLAVVSSVFSFVAGRLAYAQEGAEPEDVYFIKLVAKLSGLPTGQPAPVVIIAGVINLVLSVVGVIAVCLILYGGYLYLVSLGNEEKIKQAKRLLMNSVIGLVIVFMAYALAEFIVLAVARATGA